jgi:hypothetical protein
VSSRPQCGACYVARNGSRAAASVPCALARSMQRSWYDNSEGIHQPIGRSDSRDWPLQTRSLHACVPPLHSRLACSLPAHPRHCKVAAFRCSPLRSLFRGDGMGWSNGCRAAREGGRPSAEKGSARRRSRETKHAHEDAQALGNADFAQGHAFPAPRHVQPQCGVSRSGSSLVVSGTVLTPSMLDLPTLDPCLFVEPSTGLPRTPDDAPLTIFQYAQHPPMRFHSGSFLLTPSVDPMAHSTRGVTPW